MKIKLDENISRHLKADLIQTDHDVLTVADEGLLARPDEDIAAAAKSEDRMLFTLDSDFANIVKFPPGTHPGVILFRPPTWGPLQVNRFILDFVHRSDLLSLQGCLAIVETNKIRVRRPKDESDS